MKILVLLTLLPIALVACSTSGGIYKKGDVNNGDYSTEKTVMTIFGVIGAALVVGSGADSDDFDYTSNQYLDGLNSIFSEPNV